MARTGLRRGLMALAFAAMALPAMAAEPVSRVRIAVVTFYSTGKVQLSGIDYVIEQQGWLRGELAKRGIGLEWFPAPNAAVGPIINEAFAGNQIQFASYGELPALILNGNSPRIRTQLLVPGNPSDAYILVPKNSTARGIEDLKGKKLAIHKGRPWEIPLLHLLDSKKLSYSDFQVYNINPEASSSAIATGAIDGMVATSPYALVDKGVARILWSTKQGPQSWKTLGGFWGSKDFIDAHPDIAQLVVTAYVKAAAWAADEKNREAFIKLGTRNGTSAAVVRRTYDDPALTWKQRWSPLFSQAVNDHYRDAIAYAFDKKIIRNRFDYRALVNDRLVAKAVDTLGLKGYWAGSKLASRTPAVAAPAAVAAKD